MEPRENDEFLSTAALGTINVLRKHYLNGSVYEIQELRQSMLDYLYSIQGGLKNLVTYLTDVLILRELSSNIHEMTNIIDGIKRKIKNTGYDAEYEYRLNDTTERRRPLKVKYDSIMKNIATRAIFVGRKYHKENVDNISLDIERKLKTLQLDRISAYINQFIK